MKKFISYFPIILLLLCAQPLISQFGLKMAPTIGANYNIGTGSVTHSGSGVKMVISGRGSGMVIGAQADMQFTPVIGIIANLQFYDDRSWDHTQKFTFQGRPISLEEDFDIAYTVIEPLLKISIPNTGVYFVGGPALGFVIQNSWQYAETVTGFPTQRERGEFEDAVTRFEFKLGSGFDIPVSRSIDITPQLSFGFGITNMAQNVSVRILSFQLATSVKFKII